MATYTWICRSCDNETETHQGIAAYSDARTRIVPRCCGAPMERRITVVPGLARDYALAGDRHYDGLRASDGTDISTRSKHRAYMKQHNLTTIDDFKQEFSKAEKWRKSFAAGEYKDKDLRQTLDQNFNRSVTNG